jgi:hypothetical protein
VGKRLPREGLHPKQGKSIKEADVATRVEGSTRSRVEVADRSNTRLTTETKHSLKTTEFWVYLAAVAGVLIAAWIVSSGNGTGGGADTNGDAFDASRAWLYVSVLTVGYLVSRGLAKAGSREPFWADGSNDDR